MNVLNPPQTFSFRLISGEIFHFTNYQGFSEFIDNLEPEPDSIIDIPDSFTYSQFQSAHQNYINFIEYKKAVHLITTNTAPSTLTKQKLKDLCDSYNLNNPVLEFLFIKDSPAEKIIKNNKYFIEPSILSIDSIPLYFIYSNYKSEKFSYACINGHIKVIQWLKDSGFDIKSKNYLGIKLAAFNGHINLFNWFHSIITTESEPEPDIREILNEINYNCFCLACFNNHLEMARLIYSNDDNIRNPSYSKWLHFEELISYYPSFEFPNTIVLYPYKYQSLLEYLLQKKYDILDLESHSHLEIIEWIYDVFKSNIKIHDINYNVFTKICSRGLILNAKWMVSNGYSSFKTNLAYSSAFYEACINNNLEMAQWLFSINPVEDINNVFINTCKYSRLEVAQWLFSLDQIYSKEIFKEAFRGCLTFDIDFRVQKNNYPQRLPTAQWLWSLQKSHPHLVELNIHYGNDEFIRKALQIRDLDILKWLYSLDTYDKAVIESLNYQTNSSIRPSEYPMEIRRWVANLPENRQCSCLIM